VEEVAARLVDLLRAGQQEEEDEQDDHDDEHLPHEPDGSEHGQRRAAPLGDHEDGARGGGRDQAHQLVVRARELPDVDRRGVGEARAVDRVGDRLRDDEARGEGVADHRLRRAEQLLVHRRDGGRHGMTSALGR
jgi:hypothetical protein